jgi:hypothetical protein
LRARFPQSTASIPITKGSSSASTSSAAAGWTCCASPLAARPGGYGGSLDNVALVAATVPEPGMLALSLAALAAMGAGGCSAGRADIKRQRARHPGGAQSAVPLQPARKR